MKINKRNILGEEIEVDENPPPSVSENPVAEAISQMEKRALELHLQEEEEKRQKRKEHVERLRQMGMDERGRWLP